jgi:antitoxin MazE
MSKATLTKWGNAQGIRLPVAFCRQLGLSVGDKVSIRIEDGNIVLSNEPDEQYTLKARMKAWTGRGAALTESEEFDWGEPVGKEIW